MNAATFPGPTFRDWGRFLATDNLRRRLVRSDMRHRLLLLRPCYTRMIETLDQAGDAEMRTWLRGAAEGCQDVADTLRGSRRPSLLAIIPLALAGIAKVRGASWLTFAAVIAGVFLVEGCVYLLAATTLSSRAKRDLFLHTAPPAESGMASVYDLETALFARLERRRPPERQADLDAWVLAAGSVLVAAIVISAVFGDMLAWVLVDGCSAVLYAAIAYGLGPLLRKRTPR